MAIEMPSTSPTMEMIRGNHGSALAIIAHVRIHCGTFR
jgi:hypothetical protein